MQDQSVCCPDPTSVHTFRVSLDGTLYGDEITAIPWGTGRLLIHHNGVFAYRGHSEYCIGTSGAPELVATFPSDTPDLSSAAFDASGRYLVTSGPATYRIDSQTGLLSLAASGPERTPGPVAAHPSRDLVFVCPSSGDVDTYRLDRDTGALTFLAKHPDSYSSWGGRLDVEPSGRFLYLQNDTGLEDYLVIEGFRIESDGSLTEAYYTEDWESARKLAFFLGPPF